MRPSRPFHHVSGVRAGSIGDRNTEHEVERKAVRPGVPAAWLYAEAKRELYVLRCRYEHAATTIERRELSYEIAACEMLLRDGIPGWDDMDGLAEQRAMGRREQA